MACIKKLIKIPYFDMFSNNFIERGAKLDDQGIEASARLHSPATHNMSGFIECS